MKKYALFTCDTEFLPPWYSGSWADQERTSLERSLQIMTDILEKNSVRGTFYCQGLLVEAYPDLIRGLGRKHCIGSHGFNHENYGRQEVIVQTKEQPDLLGDKQRKYDLINKCKGIHRDVLGYEPEVFVAPFDSIDYDLLEVLESLGFKIDSSFNNYHLGLKTKLFKPEAFNIYELPLTVIRFEEFGYKNVLQGLTYDYSKISQVKRNDIIYITSHPWEFVDTKIPHPEHELITGDAKIRTLEKLLQDLLNEGYEFVDPLQLLERESRHSS